MADGGAAVLARTDGSLFERETSVCRSVGIALPAECASSVYRGIAPAAIAVNSQQNLFIKRRKCRQSCRLQQ